MTHVAQMSFFTDPQCRDPERLLTAWPTISSLAQAAAAAGQRVSVIQASVVEGRLSRGPVDFHFVKPDPPGESLARTPRLASLLRELAPDVCHVQGLGFGRDVVALRSLFPRRPILLQDRADRPPRFWRRHWWVRQSSAIDGVFFCDREQAAPFVRAGVLAAATPVFEVAGTCTDFTPGPRSVAREVTGLHGNPAVLFVGHLNPNKDPMVILEAVSLAACAIPGIQLWMCFGTAPLRAMLEARIAEDECLRGRVHLLGAQPHAHVQELMRAADLFVLASHREGGSFALMEAMACGLPAAVSDIPSSRALLGTPADGAGLLWPRGDAEALARCLIELAARPVEAQRARTRARFEACHSMAAVGRKLAAAYLHAVTGARS
jgi:glycosyltransferase involved in cell wall biosynthesis